MYLEVKLDAEMRNYLNTKTSKIFEKTAEIIKAKEEAFPHETEEIDLKEKIAKWKANERKKEVFTCNKLASLKRPCYVKEGSFTFSANSEREL